MTTISDPSAMTPDDPRWLSWFMQQRRFDRLSRKAQTGASLITDFAAGVYEMGYPGQRRGSYELSDIVKFSRSTGGGRFNSSGVYEWVGNDVPRLTYDPVTLQPLGLLVEEQRTNLIRHSANLANVAWPRGAGVSISTDGQLAPNGTPMQLITLAGTTNHNINQVLLAPLATGQAHTISVYVKPKSAPFPFQIAYYDGNSALNSVFITPQPGVIQRIDFTFTPTVVAASPQIRILGFSSGGDGDQVYIWGVQSEQASAPSTYIQTTTAQVTRAADVVSVNTLSPWYNPLAGTFKARAAGIIGQAIVTAGTAIILADSAPMKNYSLSYSADPSATSLVIGKGIISSISYFPRSGA